MKKKKKAKICRKIFIREDKVKKTMRWHAQYYSNYIKNYAFGQRLNSNKAKLVHQGGRPMYNKVIYLSKQGEFRVRGDTVNNYAETSVNGDCPKANCNT